MSSPSRRDRRITLDHLSGKTQTELAANHKVSTQRLSQVVIATLAYCRCTAETDPAKVGAALRDTDMRYWAGPDNTVESFYYNEL